MDRVDTGGLGVSQRRTEDKVQKSFSQKPEVPLEQFLGLSLRLTANIQPWEDCSHCKNLSKDSVAMLSDSALDR